MGYKYDYDRLKPQNADWENDWHYKKKNWSKEKPQFDSRLIMNLKIVHLLSTWKNIKSRSNENVTIFYISRRSLISTNCLLIIYC